MELIDVVELTVRPCGDCVHSEILRTKCVFGSSGFTDLNDTQLYKKLRGTFVRECQNANVYCQIPHVDSLEYLKVDQPVRAVKPSARPVSLKSVGRFENIHTIFSVIADLAKSHPRKIVHINDVCRECEKQGLSCDSTKELVSRLKKRGDLLAVNSELFRMVV